VVLSYGPSHDSVSLQARSGTSLLMVVVAAARVLPPSLIHELVSPAAVVAFGGDQLGRLDLVGPAHSPPLPELQGMAGTGVAGCPRAWAHEPLLPCRDVPGAFSPDPSTGLSTAQSASGTLGAGYVGNAVAGFGCGSGEAEGFLLGSSYQQVASAGALILSLAFSCPSAVTADKAANSVFAAAKVSFHRTPPVLGDRVEIGTSLTPPSGSVVAIAVVGTTLVVIEDASGSSLPVADAERVTAVGAAEGFLKDQLRQLERTGPPVTGS
jgi:hypothetical protein